MNLQPEVVEQLEQVLSSVEQLLPKAAEPIEYIEDTRFDDLVGIDR